ncbi:uncharacterized protein EI90DRAFT_825546 [Cantharellus anzutake]|uniref:uncharacterized protein n=1 Tax=Cantharellus anzutake TaxID=1750568 RepID=UPI001902F1AA|nr:uncharacterized protein EI90DRAFT_825546 [Cantharellus anzutake]KAF8343069.1 hypothetical protein EI90DRAFT_825546 [Cantharellus anzutake]
MRMPVKHAKRTRCLPSPGTTGCKRCGRLGKECVFDQVRKPKRSNAPTEDTIQIPQSLETNHEIVAALFSEVRKPTMWTLKATMILLDHFRTVEDVRYNYVKGVFQVIHS